MYSLYRAWLSLGPCPLPTLPSPPPLNLTAPVVAAAAANGAPDVSLQVGPSLTHFSAHRTVLSAHSGFFKAALLNQTETGPIAVPNVNVDEFSSLLTFMYTGYLDLNLSNIYNILLATHILHMPRALEICRSFLLQSQSLETRPGIIKPIPSRKTVLPTQQIFQPAYSNLKKSEITPFKTVAAPPTITCASSNKQVIEKDIATPTTSAIELVPTTSATKIEIASTSQMSRVEPKKSDSSTSTSKSRGTTGANQKRDSNKRRGGNGNSGGGGGGSSNANTSGASSSNNSGVDDGNKVIIDIACCDGPVRFQRVINKNYGYNQINEPSINKTNLYEIKEITNRNNAAMNKAMNENIIKDRQLADENQASSNNNNNNNNNSTDLFTCLYCNHTFKSQYCYQKHARRHLNPITVEAVTGKTNLITAPSTITTTATTVKENIKREVKLLDMNVQYYPCKTCGSKFPSYYFVHKHRKLCHADEMTDGNNSNSTNNNNNNSSSTIEKNCSNNNNNNSNNVKNLDLEIKEVGSENSSASSAIDVEAVNN